MKAWAFNEDQLLDALAAWAESIVPTTPDDDWLVQDLQRDTNFVTMFLRSPQAAKLRIDVPPVTMQRTVLDPSSAWPFPKGIS